MSRCKDDVNKPSVDESQIECCGVYPSNCVVASEIDPFLKVKKGETLTNIIKLISENIKKLFQKFNDLDRYYEFTGVFSQTGLDPIAFSTSSSSYTASFTTVRNSVGNFSIIFSQPVLTAGTIVIIPNKNFPKVHTYTLTGDNTINILTYDETFTLTDGILTGEFIHIKTPK